MNTGEIKSSEIKSSVTYRHSASARKVPDRQDAALCLVSHLASKEFAKLPLLPFLLALDNHVSPLFRQFLTPGNGSVGGFQKVLRFFAKRFRHRALLTLPCRRERKRLSVTGAHGEPLPMIHSN